MLKQKQIMLKKRKKIEQEEMKPWNLVYSKKGIKHMDRRVEWKGRLKN